ncbi:Vegetative incompatibility protein HET-E-1 [Cladobotryum mycophilum]|uniref:Vegetative incompatibility protein HET-E-1 n=1 Tax=Cladobotryum mycophilum TaxID=491253 RepID=A0ABR0SIU3_9HYPO
MEPLSAFASAGSATELCVQIISLCFAYSKDVKNATAEIEQLRRVVTSLQHIMESIEEMRGRDKGAKLKDTRRLDDAVHEAQSLLQKLHYDVSPGKRRKAMRKIGLRSLKWPFEKQDVQNRMSQLDQCTHLINMGLQVDQTNLLLDMDCKAVLDKLPVANGASFNSFDEDRKPKCLPDTRVELLESISQWANDLDSHAVFAKNRLGASFFFKRGEADRGGLLKFFTTVAADLARRLPAFAPGVKEAIDAEPGVFERSPQEQFEKLILGPLSTIPQDANISAPIVIVIDALDECDQNDVRLLIRLLSRSRELSFPKIKAFLTSRPELPPRLGFDEINGRYQDLILHEVPTPIIEKDISKFLENELSHIHKDYNRSVPGNRKLPDDWPGKDTIQILVKMAVPLFIFASTVCRFIADRKCGNPDRQLELILRYQTKSQESQLNATYLPVLSQQIDRLPTRQRETAVKEFRTIVGSIIILANPLSTTALSRLLEVPENTIADRLDMLHSVLSIPLSANGPVRLLHLSFRDFLLDPEIRDKTPLWIDEKQTHAKVADHCLRVLDDFLKSDLCNIKLPGTPSSDIDRQIESGIKLVDDDRAHRFLLRHFLHWLEALSLMGRIRESMGLIKLLQTLVESTSATEVSNFLEDARRFTIINVSVIESWPLQVYYSALVFAPTESTVRTNFKDYMPSWLSLPPLVDQKWESCLQVFEGHHKEVYSAAFSHDSTLVASASQDKTIRIWLADTGECLQELTGHSGSVITVMFSHDSSLLVSASDDHTIRVWCAETGRCARILTGHTEMVLSVAFSHNSSLIVSGSADDDIRIWDADTGNCIHTLSGCQIVSSVVFSHNSSLVASASFDHTVRLWDVDTGTRRRILRHDEVVHSVAFSHDSSLVASGSDEGQIKIWRVDTGNCVNVCKINSFHVYSIAFSHDSTFIASGNGDRTVRIWRTDNGNRVKTLNGHNTPVSSVVFSHDSTRIASASEDGTVHIWDASVHTQNETQKQSLSATQCIDTEGLHPKVLLISLSHDSTLIASWGPGYKTVRIWSTNTGYCIQQIEFPDRVQRIAFHHEPSHLLSITYDGTVNVSQTHTGISVHEFRVGSRDSSAFSHDSKLLALIVQQDVQLWSVDTGHCLHTLTGHTVPVHRMVFSNNSTLLASVSRDSTVRLWDTKTGNCMHKMEGYDDDYDHIIFSHDSKFAASASVISGSIPIRVWRVNSGDYVQTYTDQGYDDMACVISMAFSHDSSIIAMVIEEKVLVLRTETGELIQKVRTGFLVRNVKFDVDKPRLVTDIGAFDITESQYIKQPVNGSYRRSGYGISLDEHWIMWGEQNLLRLPWQYKLTTTAVQEDLVVLGSAQEELDTVFRWYDEEPSLRVAIISGVGRAFCAGSDIQEWVANMQNKVPFKWLENGFAGLSWRKGKKPIIAAVNGLAHGAGCEMVLNCDLIIASESATFSLPEVKRGFITYGSSVTRLIAALGKQRASEFVLTGRAATAAEFERFGLCNYVVKDNASLMDKTLEYARQIADNCPDSVIVSRRGLQLVRQRADVSKADGEYMKHSLSDILNSSNMQEGLQAFLEKREPCWQDSKL